MQKDLVLEFIARKDFNPPVPRGTGPPAPVPNAEPVSISIHPSLAGRDAYPLRPESQDRISIHPSLAGRDCSSLIVKVPGNYFNPPVPRGTGRDAVMILKDIDSISIHPSLAGRDSNHSRPFIR